MFALLQATSSNITAFALSPSTLWPSYVNVVPNYPGAKALAQPAWPAIGQQPFPQGPLLRMEYGLEFGDRNDALVESSVVLE